MTCMSPGCVEGEGIGEELEEGSCGDDARVRVWGRKEDVRVGKGRRRDATARPLAGPKQPTPTANAQKTTAHF